MDVPVLVAPSAAGAAESGSFLRPRCPSVRSQCFTFGAALCISVLALSVIDVPAALKVTSAHATLPWAARAPYRWVLRQGHRVALKAMETPGGISGQTEHKVTAPPQFTEEQLRMRQALQEHQRQAARLSNAEEARNLMQYGPGFGTLSTNSLKQPGYPSGSAVLFATDPEGRPVFTFSAMSAHTQDLAKDPRVSLVAAVENFKGIEDGRITFLGDVTPLPDAEVPDMKALFKARHPTAVWVDFLGDLSWWRMTTMQSIRFNWGFASAGTIDSAEYSNARPDPIAAFAKPVATHMNEDHADANVAMVNHYLPIKVDSASIQSLDRLGMFVQVKKDGVGFRIRLPFPREATDRKAVKEILVEMTRAAAGQK